jgi:hypothetical protein
MTGQQQPAMERTARPVEPFRCHRCGREFTHRNPCGYRLRGLAWLCADCVQQVREYWR